MFKVVHDQHDTLIRVILVHQPLDLLYPVDFRASLRHVHASPTFQWCEQHRPVAHAVAFVLVVVRLGRSRFGTRASFTGCRWVSSMHTSTSSSGSLRRRNVGVLFSRKDHLKYILIKYKISVLNCLQTIHPKKYIGIFLRHRLWGLREQPIGDHGPFHASIERSQDRNQTGLGAPFTVVLGREPAPLRTAFTAIGSTCR